MPSKESSVSILKFVGTVSLGLLTGINYTISTVSVPSLLSIPTASGASRALSALVASSRFQLRALTTVASTAFLAAYVLSPRPLRHPYLLYVGILSLASTLSGSIAPYVPASLLSPLVCSPAGHHQHPKPSSSSSSRAILTPLDSSSVASSSRGHHHNNNNNNNNSSNRMEQSYDLLGDAHSDDAAGTSGAEDGDDAATPAASAVFVNGEEIRTEIDEYQRRGAVQTAIAGLGFMVAVLGIWGDGVAQLVNSRETIVFEF